MQLGASDIGKDFGSDFLRAMDAWLIVLFDRPVFSTVPFAKPFWVVALFSPMRGAPKRPTPVERLNDRAMRAYLLYR